MKKIIYLLISVFLISSCEDDCSDIACFTPPAQVILNLVDSKTGEDLFVNNTLNKDDISFKDENNQNVEFQYEFDTVNEVAYINLSEIGWNTGAHEYILSIGSELEIDLKMHTEEKHKDCCTFFQTINFDISSHEFSQSNTTGIITVTIQS